MHVMRAVQCIADWMLAAQWPDSCVKAIVALGRACCDCICLMVLPHICLVFPHCVRVCVCAEAELMEMIERADADQDGEISPEEFYVIMTKKTFA